MKKRFLVESKGILVGTVYEASLEAEGTPIIEGTFRQTRSTWTGIFESIDGQVYEIVDGIIKKEAA